MVLEDLTGLVSGLEVVGLGIFSPKFGQTNNSLVANGWGSLIV